MIARPWTDDVPKCGSTSVGQYISKSSSNTLTNEDLLCFYCVLEDNTYLYGLFEPHNGTDAARFIMQRMAAEILFQPLTATSTDEDIREMLRTAFVSVEKAYIENYDGLIAERTSLQYQLQTLNETQISSHCDNILSRLRQIDHQLSGGATLVLALVRAGKLYVANVGEARALLCRTDDNSVLRVVQLSVDHSLNNEDELLRLRQLGLDVNKLRNAQYLGNQPGTRCLGNYLVKGLHRAFPSLRAARASPALPAPDLPPPAPLQDARFLVLVSSGVYKRLQEVRGNSEMANKQLSQIIVENFRKTTDFKKLSQAVLEEIEQEFLSYCMKNNLTPKSNVPMTLLIRNFDFPLPNVKESDTLSETERNLAKNASVRFNPIVQSKSNTLLNQIDDDEYNSNRQSTLNTMNTIDSTIDTNRSTESGSDIYPSGRMYDKDRRIKGYVDFSCYYENVEKARKNGTLPSFIK